MIENQRPVSDLYCISEQVQVEDSVWSPLSDRLHA